MKSFHLKRWQHKQANHSHRPVVPKLWSLSASSVELLKPLMPQSHPIPMKMSGVEARHQNSPGGSIVQQSLRTTAVGSVHLLGCQAKPWGTVGRFRAGKKQISLEFTENQSLGGRECKCSLGWERAWGPREGGGIPPRQPPIPVFPGFPRSRTRNAKTGKVLGKPECLVTLHPAPEIVVSPQISAGLKS